MTGLSRRRFAQASALGGATLFMPYVARAQAKTIKIGILSDMSGTYSEATGQGDVIAAKFAVADFNKQYPDILMEVVSGDMLLKPDVGALGYDERFTLISSPVIAYSSSAGTTRLTK